MTEPRFQTPTAALDLAGIVALTGALPAGPAAGARVSITGVGSLDWAGPAEIAFLDADERGRPADLAALRGTDAGACLVSRAALVDVPTRTIALVADEPRRAFARVAAALFPAAARPGGMSGPGVAAGASVHPEARLEPDVTIDPGAVIGPGVEIGRGAVIGAYAVIGAGVRIGRDSAIGAGSVVANALIGDRVVVQPGASIGHAGLPRDRRADRPAAPSLGRAIIQDDAEIGANAAVARGRARDTVIGEATRIEALARIAPDVIIGRWSLVFAGAALEEGATLPDYAICGLDGDRRAGPPRDFKA